ncbi:glycosyltransferase family 2 protein [Labrys monachus]|uniref:Glycosyltransferase involved in cell wall biosynthesis n=1 Tax=Labrys monachus TaxID=217067 RepID=A0ABU0FJK4_9HYPH|nr:glycosyltransferase family A protein [Labrys monachus]MDQ0394790.1 glycosyltransferase involved in cell wall biosynthesis [Labrys monachus]
MRHADTIRMCWPENSVGQWMSGEGEKHLVSVVLPTHNRGSLLGRALDSIKAQTYRPIQIVVVDDGSGDATPSIVEEWMSSNVEVGLTCEFFRRDNGGAPSARNFGLVRSRGEFIQYIDSDDVLHPQKIEIHTKALLQKPHVDFVWSEHSTFVGNVEDAKFCHIDVEEKLRDGRFIAEVDIFSTTGNVWSGLYRRAAHAAAGPWNETLARWQDVEFNIRFTALGPNCIYIPGCLHSMGLDAASRIQNLYRERRGVTEGLHTLSVIDGTLSKLNPPFGSNVRRSMATFYLGLAKKALEFEDRELALSAFSGALQHRRDVMFRLRVGVIRILLRMKLNRVAADLMSVYSNIKSKNVL